MHFLLCSVALPLSAAQLLEQTCSSESEESFAKSFKDFQETSVETQTAVVWRTLFFLFFLLDIRPWSLKYLELLVKRV